jgi:hypothetical protein
MRPSNTRAASSARPRAARLRYAGGSGRWTQPIQVSDPEVGRLGNRQLVTRYLGDRRHIRTRKDATRQRHIEASLFDVLRERVVIVVDGMPVNFSVDMPMSDDVTVRSIVRMIENEVEVVVTGISRRRFRCGNKHALERNSHRCRHHEDDSDASRQWLSSEAQNCRP